MLGYIYHLIKVGSGEVLDQTSIDERSIDLAEHLFCDEFGYREQYDVGDVAVVFSHTEDEEDFDPDEDIDATLAALEGELNE